MQPLLFIEDQQKALVATESTRVAVRYARMPALLSHELIMQNHLPSNGSSHAWRSQNTLLLAESNTNVGSMCCE